ncbi:hypothetical protein [Fimbriiglobus ruber]|uniref:hypothetical protein n=1 Tax=Fimbriiglobus ruber TaxID=1908690 RepID=UPI000B4A6784|nr:hypothetical protein [Fimbriiglobus ruber]
MNRVTVERRIDAEGVLRISLPFGIDEAGREVLVTVEPVTPKAENTDEEWRARILALAGGWPGEFERPAQGEYEEREPLSAMAPQTMSLL